MARLASFVIASAIIRLVESLGGSASVDRRGSQMSGAIFVTVFNAESRTYDLYEPASQALLADDEESQNTRFFTLRSEAQNRLELADQFEKEARFDPDFWVIDVEGVNIQALSAIVPIL